MLLQQQQKQIDQALKLAQNELLQRQADEAEIQLPELDGVLQPIIDSCTKDSISHGKFSLKSLVFFSKKKEFYHIYKINCSPKNLKFLQ